MARVFLVNPPSPEPVQTPLLSFCHLAAALRTGGHEVALLDASAPFAPHDHEAIGDFTAAVRELRPTALIGASGQPGTFTREVLVSHGKPATEVAQALNTQLRGRTLYSDGWANDYTWISLLFDEADMSPAFRLDNLRSLLDERQADAWHA